MLSLIGPKTVICDTHGNDATFAAGAFDSHGGLCTASSSAVEPAFDEPERMKYDMMR